MRVNKTIDSKHLLKYIEYLLIIGVSYVLFLQPYLTSDYGPLTNIDGGEKFPIFRSFIINGRFASYPVSIIVWLFSKFNITYLSNAQVMQAVGMMIYAFCATIVSKTLMIDENTGNKAHEIAADICVMLMFINPFITETYVYGSMVWAVGVLFACLGAYYLVREKRVAGFIFACLATSFYQSDIFIMLMICYAFYICQSLRRREFLGTIKKCGVASIICVLSCVINLTVQYISIAIIRPEASAVAKSLSAQNVNSVFDNIKGIGIYIRVFLVTTSGFSPLYFSLLVFALSLFVGLFFLIKNRYDSIACLSWSIYCVLTLILPYSFGIIGGAGGYPPRVIFSIFFGIGGMIYNLTTLLLSDVHKHSGFIIAIPIAVFLVYYIYTEFGIADCYIQQAIDSREVRNIKYAIEKYEEDTNNKIVYVRTWTDSDPLYHYPEQLLHYDGLGTTYNHRVLYDSWCQGEFLNYVCGTDYDVGNMSLMDYERYFGENEWSAFSPDEQLYFEGDTLYWAVY